MVTQKANLASPVTTVPTDRDRNSDKGTLSLTESFQSFAAVSNARWNQKSTVDSGVQPKPVTEATHKDTYEKETVAKDAYSINKDKIQGSKLSKEEPAAEDMELTAEQLEALQKEIRDVIKEALDMDDAELDEILAVMNVDVLCLLDPAALQEFLLTATESEPVDLLTDSSMIDLFQQMKDGVAQILQEYGLEEADVNRLVQEFPAEGSEELPQMPQKDTLVAADMEMSDKSMNMDESMEPEPTEIHTEQQKMQPESGERTQTEKHDPEGFTVKEENTGIQVSVQTQGAQPKAGQENGRQPEQFQQGIASEIVNQLTQAMGELEETPVSFTSELQQTEIIRQVIEQIRLVSGSDMNRIEVQLYPQHLGRVQIQVMMKNGAMTAQIHAETEMAKQAIESQLQQLKDAFQERSIRVEAVEVSVGTPEFRNEQERQDTTKDNQKSRSRNGRIRLDEFGMPVEDAAMEEDTSSEILAAQGASVEFTA